MPQNAFSKPAAPAQQFLQFCQHRGQHLRSTDSLPANLDEWNRKKAEIRKLLLKSWGGFPTEPCELNAKVLGELQRDGYKVEKVIFQTRPGVWMTANAYVPAGEGKRPAVLCVHGHWKGAKQDPTVQARCIGLVKLGFFVLCVDAFGAGERGISKNLGEYHGEMVAATLLPLGTPLSGLQVYENMRAVDYLLTRPEVDGNKLGITGASGGGNQSMYAGAFDERFKAVVPVCSVGTYQAYLGAACCMCEVVPNAMTYTEEAGILSLVAPRALMVISATKDAFQFSVGEAQKSIAAVQHVFRLHGKAGLVSHDLFDSPHDYGKAMREAMYGWMTLHLKGEGQGNPIPEPAMQTEDPETLRCFPGESRPDDFMTLPKFAAEQGQRLVTRWKAEKLAHREHWDATSERLQHALGHTVLGGWPKRTDAQPVITKAEDGKITTIVLETEPGIEATATYQVGSQPDRGVAIILCLEGPAAAAESPVVKKLAEQGRSTLVLELRATGKYAVAGDRIGRAPDHNSSEWAMWTGRPLLGQWIWDARRLIEVFFEHLPEVQMKSTLVGVGAAGLVALGVGQLVRKIPTVVLVETLASYVSDAPFEKQWLGLLAPGILRDVGDVSQLAAFIAPRRLVIAGGLTGAGNALSSEQLAATFAPTHRIYELLGAGGQLKIVSAAEAVDSLT